MNTKDLLLLNRIIGVVLAVIVSILYFLNIVDFFEAIFFLIVIFVIFAYVVPQFLKSQEKKAKANTNSNLPAP